MERESEAEAQIYETAPLPNGYAGADETPRAKRRAEEPAPQAYSRAEESSPRKTKPSIAESPYKTLRPIIDNPAQPSRQNAAYAPVDIPQPSRQSAARTTKPKPIEDADFFADEETLDAPPAKPSIPGKSPAERRAEKNLVLTSDGTEELPARKPPVRREKRDTFIPERILPKAEPQKAEPKRPEKALMRDEELDEEDVFFVKPKPKRNDRVRQDEDEIDDAYVNGRVRAILAGIAFFVCLTLAFWLFATSSGQVFLAGFGLSGSADAYRRLGDDAYAGNQIKRAAEAYYQALSLDADDYDTALKVGVTQQQIGNYDKAGDAYYMCTQLRPTEIEPYRRLVKLYTSQGENEKAEYFRSMGMQNTGQDPAA